MKREKAKKETKNKPSKKAGKKKDKLTTRELRFIKFLSEGNSIAEAGRLAGYSEGTLKGEIYRTAEKSRIKEAFKDILDRSGVTEEKIAKTLAESLDANKVISANVIVKGGVNLPEADSMTKDFVEVPDHSARIKAVELAGKFKSLFPNEKLDVHHTVEPYEVRLKRIHERNAGKKE